MMEKIIMQIVFNVKIIVNLVNHLILALYVNKDIF